MVQPAGHGSNPSEAVLNFSNTSETGGDTPLDPLTASLGDLIHATKLNPNLAKPITDALSKDGQISKLSDFQRSMSPLMLGDNSSKSIRFHLEIQSNPNPTIAQSNPDRPTEIEYLQSTKFHRVHADNSGKWNKRELIEIWSNPRLGQDLEAYIKGLDQSWENNFNRQKFSGLIKEVAYSETPLRPKYASN